MIKICTKTAIEYSIPLKPFGDSTAELELVKDFSLGDDGYLDELNKAIDL